jgi:hypothetical protein
MRWNQEQHRHDKAEGFGVADLTARRSADAQTLYP